MNKTKVCLAGKQKYVKSAIAENKRYAEWFMLPYLLPRFTREGEPRMYSNLQLDTEFADRDRNALVYFLLCLYKLYAKEHPEFKIDDCHFMISNDLDTECDCFLCSKLWGAYKKNHVRILCPECNTYYYLRKDSFWLDPKKIKEIKAACKKDKYNPLKYCYFCASRLSLLEQHGKKKPSVKRYQK